MQNTLLIFIGFSFVLISNNFERSYNSNSPTYKYTEIIYVFRNDVYIFCVQIFDYIKK